MTNTEIRDTEFDIIKRLQNGAIELLAIELRDTELSDTITRGEVIADLEHRLEYVQKQVAKLKEYNEGAK